MGHYIDRKTRVARGNPRRGTEYYRTICATCHDLDGKGEDTLPLGALAWENPWGMLHKILNGQPGHEMPSLRAFGAQPAADIIRYVQQTLPRK